MVKFVRPSCALTVACVRLSNLFPSRLRDAAHTSTRTCVLNLHVQSKRIASGEVSCRSVQIKQRAHKAFGSHVCFSLQYAHGLWQPIARESSGILELALIQAANERRTMYSLGSKWEVPCSK